MCVMHLAIMKYALDIDFSMLRGYSWPSAMREQVSLLQSLRGASWQAHPHVNVFLAEGCFRQIAALSLPTAFGQRWFDVWQPPHGGGLVVIKEPAPTQTLVVGCNLHVGSQGPAATFVLLSGRLLAHKAFPDTSSTQPLLLENLMEAAFVEALQQGFLESGAQEVSLQMDGFTESLPEGLLLCSDANVTSAALRDWLSYLQACTTEELAGWDFYDLAAVEEVGKELTELVI